MDTVVNTHSRAIAETDIHFPPMDRDKSKYQVGYVVGYVVHYYSLTHHYTILDIIFRSVCSSYYAFNT